jgi:sigma-B regulation protein RsbU (phosphoserine phosphatase)
MDGTYALMTTYSVPLKDENNKVVAVLTSDLPMSMLSYENTIYTQVSKRSVAILLMQVFGILLILIIGWRAIVDMKKIQAVRREQEESEHDLKVASRIQAEIQPAELPVNDHLLLAACLDQAPEVSGDFYDYLLQGDRLYFCIGDVATRGLGAAMAMLVTRTVYRSAIKQQQLPSKVMELMNEALISINERQMYATLFVGELDLSSGIFNFCNAGHLAPYLISDGVSAPMELVPNVPLGISDWQFEEQHLLLKKGDTLFFYTDGVVELMNENKGTFGEKKLMLHMKNAAIQGDSPEALLKRIRTALRHHMGVDGVNADDLTMLSIRYQ